MKITALRLKNKSYVWQIATKDAKPTLNKKQMRISDSSREALLERGLWCCIANTNVHSLPVYFF